MILYLDTSALVKRYFIEPHSEEIMSIWEKAGEIFTSGVTYAEALASIYRKKREESIGDRQIKKVLKYFQSDWLSFIRIDVTDDLNEYINKIVMRNPLRGFDAIHLASCILVNEHLLEDVLFTCFDQRLAQAARDEGLETYPAS